MVVVVVIAGVVVVVAVDVGGGDVDVQRGESLRRCRAVSLRWRLRFWV